MSLRASATRIAGTELISATPFGSYLPGSSRIRRVDFLPVQRSLATDRFEEMLRAGGGDSFRSHQFSKIFRVDVELEPTVNEEAFEDFFVRARLRCSHLEQLDGVRVATLGTCGFDKPHHLRRDDDVADPASNVLFRARIGCGQRLRHQAAASLRPTSGLALRYFSQAAS
jgi:hypothetical protein